MSYIISRAPRLGVGRWASATPVNYFRSMSRAAAVPHIRSAAAALLRLSHKLRALRAARASRFLFKNYRFSSRKMNVKPFRKLSMIYFRTRMYGFNASLVIFNDIPCRFSVTYVIMPKPFSAGLFLPFPRFSDAEFSFSFRHRLCCQERHRGTSFHYHCFLLFGIAELKMPLAPAKMKPSAERFDMPRYLAAANIIAPFHFDNDSRFRDTQFRRYAVDSRLYLFTETCSIVNYIHASPFLQYLTVN